MEWLSAKKLSPSVELGDTIEFRGWGFGFLRKKRWARVVRISINGSAPLTERIHVVEIRKPNTIKFNPEREQPLAELMQGKVGHLLNKSIDAKTQKPSIFQRVVSFFSRLIDRVQDLFHTIGAKLEDLHENKLSKWGHTMRRVGYHIMIFFIEAFVGIAIVLSVVFVCSLIFLFLALIFSCVAAVAAPSLPHLFPLVLFI